MTKSNSTTTPETKAEQHIDQHVTQWREGEPVTYPDHSHFTGRACIEMVDGVINGLSPMGQTHCFIDVASRASLRTFIDECIEAEHIPYCLDLLQQRFKRLSNYQARQVKGGAA